MKTKTEKKPIYSKYFSQGQSEYLDLSWFESEDLSWIEDLGEEEVSIDWKSIDFPSYHAWPQSLKDKYDSSLRDCQKKLKEVVKTAEETAEIGKLKIYVECEDGNTYCSTEYWCNGAIAIAEIDDDSDFDSVETAAYAFINDYNEWYEKNGNGKRHERNIRLSELEALWNPVEIKDFDSGSGCEHDDLGSFGYTHGSIVICPSCQKRTEVW